eukprot:TRINITY_DN3176_c0_g1_i2.p1 TRINITY_DN3176_c0_g1~~TRINITY_DN3176_c0_g1_i2.p1  ORF type:complete len:274 (-),score=69.19 TRINITY_DN3176_c0_g1_i2:40-828(-)
MTIRAKVVYTLNIGNGEWVVEEGGDEGTTIPGENKTFEISLTDGRTLPLSIEKEGVILRPHDTKVANFYDEKEVTTTYYPEVEQILLQNVPGAKRVFIFDHTRRSSSKEIQQKYQIRPGAQVVHGDYTPQAGLNRIRHLFPDEADELLKKRFVIANVWRSSVGTVKTFPLAFVNAQTTQPEDYFTLKRIEKNRVGEIQLVKENPQHQWLYFSEMKREEVAIFKTFDSAGTPTTPHTAANLVDEVPDAPARESIEVRSIIFLE